ncbi:MAG TPA: hypothetical protein VIM33_01575 [Gaiellaceae bacterium]|jgi:IS4 transposase
MATRYYRFRLDGQLHGLLRRTENGTLEVDRVGDGEWVDDRSMLRYWYDPGDAELVEVDRAEARRAADGYGVELDAPAARVQDPATDLSP